MVSTIPLERDERASGLREQQPDAPRRPNSGGPIHAASQLLLCGTLALLLGLHEFLHATPRRLRRPSWPPCRAEHPTSPTRRIRWMHRAWRGKPEVRMKPTSEKRLGALATLPPAWNLARCWPRDGRRTPNRATKTRPATGSTIDARVPHDERHDPSRRSGNQIDLRLSKMIVWNVKHRGYGYTILRSKWNLEKSAKVARSG